MIGELFANLDLEWLELFERINAKEEITSILSRITNFEEVYPDQADIFRVFQLVKPSAIKVVILGQDPYHGPNQANGIAFSVKTGVKMPPSLRNIFRELKSDLNIDRTETDLSDWVKQGVFLLNSSLTVQKNKPGSHSKLGWENIIIKILQELCTINPKIIFCLWGNQAKKIYNNIRCIGVEVLASAHPSPFSFKRGFENSKPFSKINALLFANNQSVIKWSN
ncbi:uracil-DNA glycosylase [Spiroplasma clarkii]|uniref:Uracil-DNA glycosylase n=2 Tax=Spiroplasma clarkii TaxID=2139 RepID=A0A2K8KN69_9MOLU|nr:uracil-DNA glycosylase [Spiroplasma clarkii]ATX70366.1 uracil-DNA glycosylase [Spiroplasma clarkii]